MTCEVIACTTWLGEADEYLPSTKLMEVSMTSPLTQSRRFALVANPAFSLKGVI